MGSSGLTASYANYYKETMNSIEKKLYLVAKIQTCSFSTVVVGKLA